MLGLLDRLQAASAIASAYQRGQVLAHRLVEHLLAAEALQHDRRRHLALAEAGVLGAVDEVAERVLEVVLDPLRVEHHLEPRAVAFEQGGRRPHRIRTLADPGFHRRHPRRARARREPLLWAGAGVAER